MSMLRIKQWRRSLNHLFGPVSDFMLTSNILTKQKVGIHFYRNKYPLHFINSIELIKCQATVIMTSFYSSISFKIDFQNLN